MGFLWLLLATLASADKNGKAQIDRYFYEDHWAREDWTNKVGVQSFSSLY